MLLIVVFEGLSLSMNGFFKKAHKLEQLKKIINKIFKQGIGIAEKNLETRRDHWDGNVNHKSLF